jgi:peptidyl-prolyl cis-trans isomerase C
MTMHVTVNGVAIAEAAIHAEMQHHPAPTVQAAMRAAAEALVVRELLMQEARRVGIEPPQQSSETAEESLIRQLIERAVIVPKADEAACRRYFDNNRRRFVSPDGFDAFHILCAAAPDDADARAAARAKAESALARVLNDPHCFADVARDVSDCPSKAAGGSLGLIQRGDADPVFETYLMSLQEGETCPRTVETKYGFHVIRLGGRVAGRTLPFEAVKQRIAAYLEESAWRRAVHQYVSILAGRAAIAGVDFDAARSPLVQ